MPQQGCTRLLQWKARPSLQLLLVGVCLLARLVAGQLQWSEWGGWTCLQDGSASRSRTRLECTPEPGNCTTLTDTETNTEPLVVDWSEWSEWFPKCSAGNSSTTFLQSRHRSCIFPSPSFPVCSSQCGLQNRTVMATRLSPTTPCCEDLLWDVWSEWTPRCSDIVNCTALDAVASRGVCEQLIQHGYAVQVRHRNRTVCTAGNCPSCPSELERRNVTLQLWSAWGSWTSHDPCSSSPQWQRVRSCEPLNGTVMISTSYCSLCQLGQVQMDNDAPETELSAAQNCTESPTPSSLSSILLIVIPGVLLAVVLAVLGGTLFTLLCWKELRKRQQHTFDHQAIARHEPSTSSYCRELLFNDPEDEVSMNSDPSALPMVPIREAAQEGIPRHASVLRHDLRRSRARCSGEAPATGGSSAHQSGSGGEEGEEKSCLLDSGSDTTDGSSCENITFI